VRLSETTPVQTDKAGGQFHESFVDVVPSVEAYSKAAEAMKPTDGPFDDPTEFAKAAAVRRSAFGKERFNPKPTQELPCGFGIVASIGVELFGSRTWSSAAPAHWRDVDDHRKELCDVRSVGAREFNLKRNTVAVGDDVVFAAELGPVGRVWAGLRPTANRPNGTAIHGSSGPIDAIIGVELSQDNLVQSIPNSSLLPITQPPPACHTAAAPHLLRQILPWDSCLEHKQNACQHCPVADPWATTFFSRRFSLWNQRLHPSPQFVAYQSFGHATLLTRHNPAVTRHPGNGSA
jgi:hypothetical protein